MTSPVQDAQCGDTKDAQSPTGVCSLKLDKVQLIPVRFGLVEALAAKGTVPAPFETKSKPVGVRLLRDGWLYMLVKQSNTWLLHEYRIEGGQITTLLWQDGEVDNDVRTTAVGDANLVFKKADTLYACYAEVQWTAKKCSQVIKSDADRKRFMQRVTVSGANPLTGGDNLLTSEQAASVIAECAETTVPNAQPSALDYEDYEWEHKPLYKQTDFAALSAKVLPQYKNDHFYLVLNDDIGILRDLASYQALVATSLETWTSDEKNYQRFIEGCYIESQITLSPEQVDQLAVAVGDPGFVNELNDRQKQAVVEWIEFQKDPGSDHPQLRAYKKIRLKEELSEGLWDKYKELIDDIEDQYQRQTRGVNAFKFWDSNAGTPGLLDLINEEEMNAFLKEEREKLDHWQVLLENINDDRVALFTRFYPAAWYFDASNVESLQNLLAAEYSCIQDVCWSEAASELVAGQLHKMPWISIKGIFTLPAENYVKITEEILKKIKQLHDLASAENSLAEINAINAELNGLLAREFNGASWGAALTRIDDSLRAFDSLIDASYAQANTLALAKVTSEFLDDTNANKQFDPSKVFRDLPGSAWLNMLKAYNIQGLSIGLANKAEFSAFELLRDKAVALRAENLELKHKIRQTLATLRRQGRSINQSSSVTELRQSFKHNQSKLLTMETKLAEAISPLGEGPEKVGYYIRGLSPEMHADMKLMARDLQSLKDASTKLGKYSIRINAGKWDFLSLVLVIFSIHNAQKAMGKGFLKELAEISGVLSGIAGLVQGVKAATDMAAIKLVSSNSSKLTYGVNLGKYTTILGASAYAFGVISSGLKASEAIMAWRNGDTKALIAGVAEGGLVAVNSAGLIRSAQVGFTVLKADKAARATIWLKNGSQLVSMTIRLTLVGIAISALQLASTVWYNRTHLSSYLAWFENSQWGKARSSRTLEESNLQLARISTKPAAEIREFGKGKALILSLPGLTRGSLDQAGVELAAYWKSSTRNNDWKPWTQALAQQWVCLSDATEPLQIALPLYSPEINAEHGIGIELHYFPMLEAPERDLLRFQAESFTRVGRLSEVTLLKARNTSASELAPLTTQHIIWKTS
ncbi:zinc ABC transporter permease [Enterovibrio sp. ZSDZ35]|uniref:Zinc ABC transporter permease n=1 Tax=Enterovibrio qingdaonensis TaxID=2899818 RepID=A0ABT5QQF8_9GAMM|nr:toxin VasX [Enterovibrio sp. ZSDZ35]MDD1783215.1 zinc ABC transporter permease [Enterovibrio sp. ZSDZ35]